MNPSLFRSIIDWPRWALYLFSVAVTVAMLLARSRLDVMFQHRPLLIMFMLPIIFSAAAGGLWTGIVSTCLASAGVFLLFIPKTKSVWMVAHHDLIQWSILVVSGVMVSFLCEMLHRIIKLQGAEAEALRKSEDFNSKVIRTSPDSLVVLDEWERIAFVSDSGLRLMNLKDPEELLGRSYAELWNEVDRKKYLKSMQTAREGGTGRFRGSCPDAKDRLRWWEVSVTALEESGGRRFLVNSRDITERRQAEEEIRLNEARLESLLRISQHPAPSIQELLDFALNEAVALTGSSVGYIFFYDENSEVFTPQAWSRDVPGQCAMTDAPKLFLMRQTGLWGEAVRQRGPVLLNDCAAAHPLKKGLPPGHAPLRRFLTIPVFSDNRITAVVGVANKQEEYDDSDIRQLTLMMDAVWRIVHRKQAEEDGVRLRMQLLQAQKLELVGRLAGGVAHDFNNMLTAILGHTALAMKKSDPQEPFRPHLQVIEEAAHRSADLVRQLLAFARKQAAVPKILDMNVVVTNMVKMLQRLLGEDVSLVLVPGQGLGSIRIDPTQLDQVLVNLCVNARDAIAGTGRVTIETRNLAADAAYCSMVPECTPGEFVTLSVSDDGCGMDEQVLEHIFEPYFTTKEPGKGTGLGLATVYGIVRQNNGFIHVSSEPGKGSTFTVHLPRESQRVEELVPQEAVSASPGGNGETLLLAEDDEVVLDLGRTVLGQLGYQVLTAGTPGLALHLARGHTADLRLLITDVVMPEMNGRELARRIQEIKPGLKCLFISGYTSDAIAHHGLLDEGVHFLQKPFSIHCLASKVREVLELPEKTDNGA